MWKDLEAHGHMIGDFKWLDRKVPVKDGDR